MQQLQSLSGGKPYIKSINQMTLQPFFYLLYGFFSDKIVESNSYVNNS